MSPTTRSTNQKTILRHDKLFFEVWDDPHKSVSLDKWMRSRYACKDDKDFRDFFVIDRWTVVQDDRVPLSDDSDNAFTGTIAKTHDKIGTQLDELRNIIFIRIDMDIICSQPFA